MFSCAPNRSEYFLVQYYDDSRLSLNYKEALYLLSNLKADQKFNINLLKYCKI